MVLMLKCALWGVADLRECFETQCVIMRVFAIPDIPVGIFLYLPPMSKVSLCCSWCLCAALALVYIGPGYELHF